MKPLSVLVVLFTSLWVLCAFAEDLVEMKNGDVYRGTIIQQKMNSFVQIRFRDGNEKRIRWAGIKELKRNLDTEAGSSNSDGSASHVSPFNNPQYLEMDNSSRYEGVLSMTRGGIQFSASGHTIDVEAQANYLIVHHIQVGTIVQWIHWRLAGANFDMPLVALGSVTINFPFDTHLKDAFFLTGGLGIYDDIAGTDFAFGFWAGKRIRIIDHLSYRPAVGIMNAGSRSLFFQVMPLAFSIIL